MTKVRFYNNFDSIRIDKFRTVFNFFFTFCGEPGGQVLVGAVQPRVAGDQRARGARREDEENALHVPGKDETNRFFFE